MQLPIVLWHLLLLLLLLPLPELPMLSRWLHAAESTCVCACASASSCMAGHIAWRSEAEKRRREWSRCPGMCKSAISSGVRAVPCPCKSFPVAGQHRPAKQLSRFEFQEAAACLMVCGCFRRFAVDAMSTA